MKKNTIDMEPYTSTIGYVIEFNGFEDVVVKATIRRSDDGYNFKSVPESNTKINRSYFFQYKGYGTDYGEGSIEATQALEKQIDEDIKNKINQVQELIKRKEELWD